MRGWKQQKRRTREFQTRRQMTPSSGVPPSLEVCFRIANVEEVGEPRAGERQRRDSVHNRGRTHFVAPHGIGRAPIWAKSAGLRMTVLQDYETIRNRIASLSIMQDVLVSYENH